MFNYGAGPAHRVLVQEPTAQDYAELVRIVSPRVMASLDKWTEPSDGKLLPRGRETVVNRFGESHRLTEHLALLGVPPMEIDDGLSTLLKAIDQRGSRLAESKRALLACGRSIPDALRERAASEGGVGDWQVATELPIGWIATPRNPIVGCSYNNPGAFRAPFILVPTSVRDFGAARFAIYRTMFAPFNATNFDAIVTQSVRDFDIQTPGWNLYGKILDALHGEFLSAALTMWKEPQRDYQSFFDHLHRRLDDQFAEILDEDPSNPSAALLCILSKEAASQVLNVAKNLAMSSPTGRGEMAPITLCTILPPSNWLELDAYLATVA